MLRENYYRTLGVSPGAPLGAIRRAYRRLARRYHPGINPGDEEAERRFRAVSRAYAVLSDAERRRQYDLGGSPEVSGWRVESATRVSLTGVAATDVESQLEDLLEQMAGAERAEPPGLDLSSELTIELAEAVYGTITSLTVQRERQCEECGGRGGGQIHPCGHCKGRGKLVDLERLRIRIPPGIEDQSRLRLPGRGSEVKGRRGDLFVTVHVKPHAYFHRHGLDIHAEVPVTVAEAILGGEIEVPTIDGPVRTKLPPGTDGGQRFRLKDRGVELPGGKRGDHYYTVRIVVPRGLDARARELLSRIPQPNPRARLPQGLT